MTDISCITQYSTRAYVEFSDDIVSILDLIKSKIYNMWNIEIYVMGIGGSTPKFKGVVDAQKMHIFDEYFNVYEITHRFEAELIKISNTDAAYVLTGSNLGSYAPNIRIPTPEYGKKDSHVVINIRPIFHVKCGTVLKALEDQEICEKCNVIIS